MENDGKPQTPAVGEVPVFTASSCQINGSAWVLQFIFGDTFPAPPGAPNAFEMPRMVVGVPWALAKTLHHIMGLQLAEYEKQQGPVTVPRTVQAQIDKQAAEKK